MRATDLALDLFAGPACGLDGSGREFAVLACVLDHCCEPLLAVEALEFAIRESISKITTTVSLLLEEQGQNLPNNTH